MSRNILVTGGAGFIGSNFVRYWSNKYPVDNILVLDALTYAGNLYNLDSGLNSNVKFVHGDINNTALVSALIRKETISLLVHFAAESHVDRSIEDPDIFLTTNIMGTHSLLKAAKAAWLEEGIQGHFHHVSTDEVYGALSGTSPSFTEETAYAPNSPYAASKAASDFLVRAYHHTYGLHVTTSNCSNNYGPFHFPEKLIPLTILNVLQGKDIPVYGSGENVRDWLFVDDHSLGIELVISEGRIGETYNIGGCNEWKNIDIVTLICEIMDARFSSNVDLKRSYPDCPASRSQKNKELIKFVQDRAGHDFRYAIDTSKITRELGYLPTVSFEEGIEKTVDWYLDHSEWWHGVLDGSYREKNEI